MINTLSGGCQFVTEATKRCVDVAAYTHAFVGESCLVLMGLDWGMLCGKCDDENSALRGRLMQSRHVFAEGTFEHPKLYVCSKVESLP